MKKAVRDEVRSSFSVNDIPLKQIFYDPLSRRSRLQVALLDEA